MSKAETIRKRWGSIWVKSQSHGSRKIHLTPVCRYVNDSYRKVDSDVYPATHMDVCSWCENHFDKWEDGLRKTVEESIERERSVTESYRTKPDPSEPWRYVCTCGSVSVARKPEQLNIYCSECGKSYADKSELVDKKQ